MRIHIGNMSLINHQNLVQNKMSGFEVWVKVVLPSSPMIKNNPWERVNLDKTDEEGSLQNSPIEEQNNIVEMGQGTNEEYIENQCLRNSYESTLMNHDIEEDTLNEDVVLEDRNAEKEPQNM